MKSVADKYAIAVALLGVLALMLRLGSFLEPNNDESFWLRESTRLTYVYAAALLLIGVGSYSGKNIKMVALAMLPFIFLLILVMMQGSLE